MKYSVIYRFLASGLFIAQNKLLEDIPFAFEELRADFKLFLTLNRTHMNNQLTDVRFVLSDMARGPLHYWTTYFVSG